MAYIVTQSDQTVEVLTQFWYKMGPKMSPKGGPKMGPPEVGTKKKSKNVFSLAPLWGFIQGPPPFGPPFGTRSGPVLDPFWTHFGHFGPILDPFWTILVTLGDYRGHK